MPAPRKSTDRYKSMAHYFGALIRDLRDSYELRVGEPLTVAQLAARTGYSPSMLGAIERGQNLPESGVRIQAIDDALRAEGQLKVLWPVVQRLGHCTLDELASATNRTIAGYREYGSSALPQGDDMERRQLFQLAGLGLFAQSPLFNAGEPVRQMLERVLNTADSLTVDDWQRTCADYLHAVLTRPPATVRDDLVLDLAALQQVIARIPPERAADLQRAAAWLSALHANVLTRLGEYGAARRWWTTARHAADSSGDTDMKVWVRGTEAVFALYSPRAPEAVLTLARSARSLAGDRVTTGHIKAVSAEAQAFAVLGRQQEARDRLRHLQELAARDVVGEKYGWQPSEVWFTISWVLSHDGAPEAGREARDRLLAMSPAYQNGTNVRLHEAIGIGKQGGHNEALQLATQVIAGLDPAYRSQMILHTARMVLDTVPLEKRAALPALGDYRAAISASAPN
ncbi:helix-turn-helix transcriptional regulator [Sphaerisporangium sp. NPDC051017]|uniref:helix-turn-helix domain-containing protein n=1 Tax=Sphaerisporangium sp. NPDC051017 TaxID=3154636 RepID=UPI00344AD14A